MVIKQILHENRKETYTKTRVASRGIVVRDGKILLSYLKAWDVYMLPGGGLEADETIEECCVREIEEETGYRCHILEYLMQMEEYFGEFKATSHYFLCEIISQGEKHLTPEETKLEADAVWMDFNECMEMFSRYQDDTDYVEKSGIYLREYTALTYVTGVIRLF